MTNVDPIAGDAGFVEQVTQAVSIANEVLHDLAARRPPDSGSLLAEMLPVLHALDDGLTDGTLTIVRTNVVQECSATSDRFVAAAGWSETPVRCSFEKGHDGTPGGWQHGNEDAAVYWDDH